jgi:RNA polymerase sigma-70 factor (ECF subfamily)
MLSTPPAEGPDQDLLALVNQAGREGWTDATFAPIYRRYHQRCLGSLCRRVDRPVAAELAQEVMMNVFKASGCFDALSQFEAWLTLVTQNVLKNHWRSLNAGKRKAREVPDEALEDQDGGARDLSTPASMPLPDPLEEVLRAERKVRVAKALLQLPPGMRNVAVLRFRQNRGYDEIAKILGVSVNTVKSQIHEAKKRLAELLAEDAEE